MKEDSKGGQESVFQLTLVNSGLEIIEVLEMQSAEPEFWDTHLGTTEVNPKMSFDPFLKGLTSLSVTGLKRSPSSRVLDLHRVLQHKNSHKIDFKCLLVN